MIYGYIYKTTNLKDQKVYIGQNKGKFRKSYYGSGFHLKRAVNKYGKENFKIEVICYLPTKEQINEFEKFLISKYREILGRDSLYNICDGGEGHSGRIPQEAIDKMKKSLTGRKISDKHRENIRLSLLGKPSRAKGFKHTEEAKEKIKQALRMRSEEVRKGISMKLTGRKLSEDTKNKMRGNINSRRHSAKTQTRIDGTLVQATPESKE